MADPVRPVPEVQVPIEKRTGRGVVVAVVDSGANAAHPHLDGALIAAGIAFDGDGRTHGDWVDRLGHGTAVAAAIHEKSPGASLLVIRVFEQRLATSAGVLARAIEWAADRGARLVNLSLGTPNPAHADRLLEALAYARERGAFVVSPHSHRETQWLPGALPGAIGVVLDRECPRNTVRVARGPAGRPVLAASGYPRPVPGVPPERNLSGVSFASANVAGILAKVLERRPEVRDPGQVFDLVAPSEDQRPHVLDRDQPGP